MTSKEIIERLEYHFRDSRQWATFEELRVGTGYREWDRAKKIYNPSNPEQRIDFWALNCYKSKKFEKIAFEIKVSRSDFLNEIKSPEKRQQALMLSNRFYFAVPAGLIKAEELPEECGLVEFDPNKHNCRWTKIAPWRETKEPSWRFLASLARRITKKEEVSHEMFILP